MTSVLLTAPPAHTVEDLAAVDDDLEAFFDRAIARAGAHDAAYRRLWSSARDAVAGGKRVRPRLVLAVHRAFDGADRAAAVSTAVAFELLHTAFLMHDDVIDHDDLRRGIPNITGRFAAEAEGAGASASQAREYGEASAILAGDLLISAAHRLVARLDVTRDRRDALLDLVDECVFRAAAGEHADVRFTLGETPTAREIVAMIEDKTASYSFSAPLRAGAILAGAAPGTVDALGEIGAHLGVAFQLRDDVLGVFGEPDVTGKTTIGDLREGKETLLIAYARSDASWPPVAARFGRPDLDEVGADLLRGAITTSGARDRVEALIAGRCRSAIELIDGAGLPPGLADELTGVAAECGDRER
ncbi:polyprenyl synthetase family protein [Agromyces aerolatus]|uniref:polyprenyl synthetase family protein n=1 Tax=Agromyces sp. LY-1074 TaxID=3074080 RepID=UPI002858E2C9|nr:MULTISPECIES: polyprenyl synthetase family protein [unclassified Agromyces]MDR5701515.1 polyprenyl synthetase family protein [Agromyces sp. LY-1074]MDR5707878.1 polyprenyl synthetase family protein [Agromyces sp. LY-1358]